MTAQDRRRLEDLLSDGEKLTAALRREVRRALRSHREAGRPVVVWQDGRLETVTLGLRHGQLDP